MSASGGILLYLKDPYRVLLVHSISGSYNDPKRVWSIPKGSINPDELYLEGAIREFEEETGYGLNELLISDLVDLGTVDLKYNKKLYCWAGECRQIELEKKCNLYVDTVHGKEIEIDDIGYFSLTESKNIISTPQYELLRRAQIKCKIYSDAKPLGLHKINPFKN